MSNQAFTNRARASFEFLCSNLPGHASAGVPIAASRAGAAGLLNLQYLSEREALRELGRLAGFGGSLWGVKLDPDSAWMTGERAAKLFAGASIVAVASGDAQRVAALLSAFADGGQRLLAEVTCLEDAQRAIAAGAQGLIAKGQEAGGAVGEETTFILVQRLIAECEVPVFAYGGVAEHTAGACFVAGCAGAVLDSAFALTPEAELPGRLTALLERLEGDETICLGQEFSSLFRVYKRPGALAAEEMQQRERQLLGEAAESGNSEFSAAVFAAETRERVGWSSPETHLLPLSQDAVFARKLRKKYRNAAGILDGLRRSLESHVAEARRGEALREGAALAASHNTRYPILQGPMTRVSDTAAFAASVAAGGGLPFLALALLRQAEVRTLLEETARLIPDRPWGVGILGFVPVDLREEQLAVVREIRPKFAIIAGGRPDQAASLEKIGIATYLHVPAPALLKIFLEDGARRFIFEGRECGGHVGPRTSFVLWETMIDVLAEAIAGGVNPSELHIIFAGGVHDALSAAMVAAMGAPLSAAGVKIGILMGTAYLFTEEAVAGNAIVPVFQQEAVKCQRTVILESGPGHATRCVETPFFDTFLKAKRVLVAERKPVEEIRDALENLNLGRLRIASKGLARDPKSSSRKLLELGADDQRREGMYMIGQIAALRHSVTTVADLHASVSSGSVELLRSLSAPEWPAVPAPALPPPADVAIVGLGCHVPKANSAAQFWENILARVNAISEVPRERFDYDRYFDSDKKAADKIYSRWGGFVDDLPFDPMRYGIPPNSLSSIDPFQLLTLEAVHQALEDAGYLEREFPRERTSVILGLSGGLGDVGLQYGVRSLLPQYLEGMPPEVFEALPEWTEDSFAGLLLNVAPGRVANRFNLGGVNYAVDAACASSLAAIQLAARELQFGSSDVVLAGGIDTTQNPFGFLCFAKSQALSAKGRCATFDETADGIAISEGVTVLVLKRLADAERDGDRIYAVIKSVSGSSDGRAKGLTAPLPEGQMRALDRAYAQARVSPASVSLVEAHGTGTVAGDAAEVDSLASVMRKAGARPGSCAVGSVKSMIGHSKAAAGVTGLMKAALALHRKVLPPTLHVEKPNAKFREQGTPLYVNTEARPWLPQVSGEPRRAGVSSFGFGGTNFHAVLEEYTRDFSQSASRPGMTNWPSELFLWSGSAASVASAVSALQQSAPASGVPLAELAARTAAVFSGAGEVRLAIVAASVDDLRGKLAMAAEALASPDAEITNPSGVYLRRRTSGGKIAFLFPGQGSQYSGMLRDLGVVFPDVRESFAQANPVLGEKLGKPLGEFVYPPPAFSEEESKRRMSELTDTAVAQPALGVVEAAMLRLLERLGVRADMTAGHSYGEYVALYAAGVIDEPALVRLSEARGRFIKESVAGNPGTMTAVEGDSGPVGAAIEGLEGVWLANFNSPRQTIIAGRAESLKEAVVALDAKGFRTRPVPVACAFHTPLMAGARERLAGELNATEFRAPQAQAFSNADAAPYPSDPAAICELLSSHLVRPVRFVEQIRAMYDAGARVFIEAGPKSVLSSLTRQILDGRDAVIVTLDSAERHGITQLLHALAQLAAAGVAFEAPVLFAGRRSAPLAPAKGDWLLNASGVRRKNEPAKIVRPVSVARPTAPPPPVAPAIAAPVAPVVSTLVSRGDQDAVLVEFQKLMGQFLETQSQVMSAFLQGGAPVLMPAAMPLVPTAPLPVKPTPAAAAPVFVVAPAVPLAAATPASAPRRDVRGELLGIVSERTGYPAEMLGLDQNIEADLGIDSIKRVEILSAYQRKSTAAEQPKIQQIMERLTSRKTLREIAELLESIAPAAAPPSAPAVPATAPAAATRDVRGELLAIVSERTGYPAEMLGLDQNIEADLGIDSIKRVEILSAYQRKCSTTEQPKIQQIMERLTSRKTLREIAELLETVTPVAAPVPIPQAAVEEPAATRDVRDELLAIVSERTGYPAEMLGLDQNIEADLGIDSIKRVEILSAYQRKSSATEQPKIQQIMERLTSRKTLREIAELLENVAPASAPQSAPSVPVTAPPAARDVRAELLAIVSERTGYPAEMLGLDQNIEADLGIDSIKRVEILSAYQRKSSATEQPKIQQIMERLTSRKTLREIAELLEGVSGKAAPAAVTVEAVGRFRFALVPAPRNGASRFWPGRVSILTSDGRGIAAGVAEALEKGGERPFVFVHRSGPAAREGSQFFLDVTDPAAVQAALEAIRQEAGPVGAVFHLLPLGAASSFSRMDREAWKEHTRTRVRSLYLLTRATQAELQQRGAASGALLCGVTAMGGAFALTPGQIGDPVQSGVVSYLRTAAIEMPEVLTKILDLDGSEKTTELAARILEETCSGDSVLEVSIRGGDRFRLVPEIAEADRAMLLPGRDWVFLLTGGARGITAEIAAVLAERYQPTLILAGSSELPAGAEPHGTEGVEDPKQLRSLLLAALRAGGAPVRPADVEKAVDRLRRDREIRRNIERLRALGATVEYRKTDVRSEATFGSLLDSIYAQHGRLDVVIHGAGIIEDKLIADKEPESFDRVVHTKADSVFTLSRKLRPESLKCLLLMSSVTAAYGNRGQADYGAANGIMNGVAALLDAQWPGRVVALNWGPWDQAGMVTDGIRAQFLERRVQLIPPAGGADAVCREIEAGPAGDPVVVYGDGPWRDRVVSQPATPVSRSLA